MIGDLFRGTAAVGLGTVALWLGAAASFPQRVHVPHLPAFLQADRAAAVSTSELVRRVDSLEQGSFDHRLTVVETTLPQILQRLESLENLLRASLIGLVAVVFNTVWSLVARIKRNYDDT